jgi:hypothetical protein
VIVDLIVWGIDCPSVAAAVDLPTPVAFFLGPSLWDLVFRGKNGVALCLLEEVHSQNLISVMAPRSRRCRYIGLPRGRRV